MSLVVVDASPTIAGHVRKTPGPAFFVQHAGELPLYLARDFLDEFFSVDLRIEGVLCSFAAEVLLPRGPRVVIAGTEESFDRSAKLAELLRVPVVSATADTDWLHTATRENSRSIDTRKPTP